jgi:hypothetical protein
VSGTECHLCLGLVKAEIFGPIRGTSLEILGVLFSIMRKPRISPGDRTRFMICADLLDRAYGKSPQALAVALNGISGSIGGPREQALTALPLAARRDNGKDRDEA